MPPNVVLSCTAEGDPTNFWMSPVDDNLTPPQDLEDDPADSPVTLGYRTLSKVKSQQVPKLPVLSVMLQDCRDLLGPDGVLKMEFEEGEDADDGDDLFYEDDEDDSDYDPKSKFTYREMEKKQNDFKCNPEGEDQTANLYNLEKSRLAL